jgi:hypothetical protein
MQLTNVNTRENYERAHTSIYVTIILCYSNFNATHECNTHVKIVNAYTNRVTRGGVFGAVENIMGGSGHGNV